MSIFEKARLKAALALAKGIGATPTDASVWTNAAAWGAAGSGRRKQYNDKALMLESFTSWVYICTKLNAQTLATVPLRLYVEKRTRDEKFLTLKTRPLDKRQKRWLGNPAVSRYLKRRTKAIEYEEVTDHVFLDMMDTVNPMMNQSDLMELTSTFLDLTGEAFWWIQKGGVNQPAQVWPIPSQYMKVKLTPNKVDTGVDLYEYRHGSISVTFKPEEVVYFKYPNPKNIFQGMSILNGVADAVYTYEKMWEFEESVFENKARVGGIVTSDENYSDETLNRLKEQWRETYSGAAKSGKTLFLPKGLKFQMDALSMQELSFIEGRKITREEICAAFDVPIAALVSTDVNRANAETADYRHMKNGIAPRCRRIEQKMNEQLVPMFDERLFVAFDDCVPEDKEFELRRQQSHITANIETINEIRSDIGLDPVPWGDTAWIGTGLQPFDESMLEEPEEEEPAVPGIPGIPTEPEPETPEVEHPATPDLDKPEAEDDSPITEAMVLEQVRAILHGE